MKSHPNAGGLGVNWLIFGSSGYKTKPEGGVLENYTMCAEKNFRPNYHIKTICDPLKVLCLVNPHFAIYRRGFHTLTENGEIVEGYLTRTVSFEKIRINHYFSKSKEEFMEKRERGTGLATKRPIDDFYGHDQNVICDTEILSRI
ncbi:MAG: hypothetical protein IJS42_00545 [Synergistaceae bacterium]|nr:hypothetical protein [Synergistaceae bacterium]